MTENQQRERFRRWRPPVAKSALSGRAYSLFVRWMRLILPLIAIGIVGLLMAWPRVEETMAPVPKEAIIPQTIGKNELVNPRFESEDEKSQPFTVTANRAVQSAKNPDVLILDHPVADIILQDGTWLAVEAKRGAYRQESEKLLLEENVKLFHDQGYELKTAKLVVDMKSRQAWSDQDVYGQGPAGTLEATGMQAHSDKGLLIFTGPVKLVLNRAIKGL